MINYTEWHNVINISEYRVAAMYMETDVRVFPKQLKRLTTVQNIITKKL